MQTQTEKVIVITGSTEGIGYGLAESFLDLGCSVVISSRTPEKVSRALDRLAGEYGNERVFGQTCDVTDFSQVQALWDAATAHFGRVDIWINNAGAANAPKNFWEHDPETIKKVVSTNLTGAMYGSVVALRGMLAQGSGALYNMEGYGSTGRRMTSGLALYGSTKAGLHFFNQSLMDEVKDTPILVGALQPGMVITRLITDQYEGNPQEWQRAKRIFNIIADRVETVAPWLAQKVLDNRENGVTISRISNLKIMARFLLAPFRKRDLFG